MNKYYYDLHIHSCLSPCADDDATPANIAGMAMLKGLNIVALTDHNSCGNCPAFFNVCKKLGLIPIAGAEVTTAEEIHLVCLFEFLEDAMSFNAELREKRIKIKNKTSIFGNQLYIDEEDNVTGEEPFLLSMATELSLSEACALANKHNGFFFPAHVERPSNGIISILGDLPDNPKFSCIEFADNQKIEAMLKKAPSLSGKKQLINSDAHHLWDINEAENYLMINDDPYSSAYVRKQLFEILRGQN